MKKEKLSQKKFVLNHLQRFGFIEPLVALREYGCYRLGAIIFKLRDEGYDIITERMEGTSAITGNRVSFARYVLLER